MNTNSNGLRVWIPWSMLLAGGLALILMYSDVQALKQEMPKKASQETIEAQNAEILRRLDRIERKLDGRDP